MPCITDQSRELQTRAHGWSRVAWIAPFFALWLAALVVAQAGTLRTGCTDLCVVANGWLWYTVFYATLSLSALVGAIEVLLWMRSIDRASAGRMKSSNH